MPSQSSLDYLERQKIVQRPFGSGLFAMGKLHSHRRAVVPIPELMEPDTPLRRYLTQPQNRRPAFKAAFFGPLVLEKLR